MLQQLSINDQNGQFVADDTPLPDIDAAHHEQASIRAVFPSHLRLLTSDTVLLRECLPLLDDAQAMLKAAQHSAELIVKKAEQQAEEIRRRAEEQGQLWLDNKRDELLAEMYFQQVLWLSQLQPVWLEALKNALRNVVGETDRPDAFAQAISVALKEFKKDADLQLTVHPDDLGSALQALTQLTTASYLIVVNSDNALGLGTCQLRSPDLEVVLQLDRAVNIALGKS